MKAIVVTDGRGPRSRAPRSASSRCFNSPERRLLHLGLLRASRQAAENPGTHLQDRPFTSLPGVSAAAVRRG